MKVSNFIQPNVVHVEVQTASTKSTKAKALQQPLLTFSSNEIKEKGLAFEKLLSTLHKIAHPAPHPRGLIGGPSTLHPNCCYQGIKEIQQFLHQVQTESKKDRESIEQLNALIDPFVEAYKAFLGAGIHYPGVGNPEIRYVNKEGETISKEAFEAIIEDYKNQLDSTYKRFFEINQALSSDIQKKAFLKA